MQRFMRFFMIIGILSLLLTACGTSSGTENTSKSANQAETTEQTSKESDASSNHDIEEEAEDTKEPSQKNGTEEKKEGESKVQRPNEQPLSYTLNGEAKEETARLTQSDNQEFSLYLLPDYQLTGEEPNKDSLFLKENDYVFMRIEVLPLDTDVKTLKENTTAQLKAVSDDIKVIDPSIDEFKNATALEASKDGEIVTALIINQKEAIVKLTLFTTEQADHRDALLQMAKTIKASAKE
ncbi:hypothetical protein [Bacillus tuaregi]|uniref:hypothetical protein n=1 Tax=Bacillus tuaregi TaxID=1816695 RepID=UPI0008F91263|nr:hypothetical protein [Bacillus tuaregi]